MAFAGVLDVVSGKHACTQSRHSTNNKISIFTILTLAVGFAACGGSTPPAEEPPAAVAEERAENASDATEANTERAEASADKAEDSAAASDKSADKAEKAAEDSKK